MGWISLGTRKPTFEWQLYDSPVTDIEVFKVSNTWTISPFYRLRAYLGQFFVANEVITSIVIYPVKSVDRVIELQIPERFKQSGLTTRYIGIKLGNISKPGLYPYDWEVQLWEFV